MQILSRSRRKCTLARQDDANTRTRTRSSALCPLEATRIRLVADPSFGREALSQTRAPAHILEYASARLSFKWVDGCRSRLSQGKNAELSVCLSVCLSVLSVCLSVSLLSHLVSLPSFPPDAIRHVPTDQPRDWVRDCHAGHQVFDALPRLIREQGLRIFDGLPAIYCRQVCLRAERQAGRHQGVRARTHTEPRSCANPTPHAHATHTHTHTIG